ncbi:MAG: hypothetical protein LBF70_00270 [Holosporales bacterium]|jgi:glutamine amidotransferase-like uncharacterized protein|nr:hypothetical protein [Holosporales bacterium]
MRFIIERKASEILLYKDAGVAVDSFRHTYHFFKHVRIVDSDFLKNENWIDIAKILIFPGGADKQYAEKLQGVGCENIKTFVKNGGAYLGICAGGYFGTSKVEFALGTNIEVNEIRQLSFFPGTSRGPFLKDFVYNSEKGACAARIRSLYNGDIFYTYFNGGCTFDINSINSDDMKNIQVLAVYADKNDTAAIVRCKYGEGYAILSGVHFEYNPMLMTNTKTRIIDALIKTQKIKDRFTNTLFSNLKLE